ncbi:MAG: T9SS type A sorting domain-containing protein [Bacteroidota bacterium]
MKTIRMHFIINVLSLITLCQISSAQLSGIKTIPGDYATIADAVTDANSQGVGSGGVIFNVAADYTESITSSILLTATGTASDQIIFQKNGAGANPLVTRTDAGSLSTSVLGGQGDAVITIHGSDYVTFDGINVSTSDQGIEYGYLFWKVNGTNGSKNVIIKNSTVTMTKGTSAFVTGIYISNLVSFSPVNSATGVTVSSNGGRHENISILSDTVQNVFVGIMAVGYNNFGVTSQDLYDLNTMIGSSGNGNVIQNYGGNTASLSYGIYAKNQHTFTVAHNTINNNNGGGTGFTGGGTGIYIESAYNENIQNNVITLTSSSGTLHGIESQPRRGDGVTSNNTITLSQNSSFEAAHIYYAHQVAPNSITINNNSLSYGGAINVSQSSYMIYLNTTCPTITASGNYSSGTSTIQLASTSAQYYMYYRTASTTVTGTETITDNTFSDFVFIVPSGGSFYFLTFGIGSFAADKVCHDNIISGITVNANRHYSFEGMVFQGNSLQIYDNTIQTINGTSSSGFADIKGINVYENAAASSSIYSNTIADITTQGYITGITTASGTNYLYQNSVYDLSSTHTSSIVSGLSLADVSTSSSSIGYVHNNFISDLQASSSSQNDAVRGINISSLGTKYLFNNTIYLNASSSTSGFGSSGVSVKTTVPLDLRNNIIVNTSDAVGTGKTTALRFDNTSLTNYSTNSDYNCLYGGTPSTSNLIFYDGTNSDQTLAQFQTRVKARERHSVSEMPSFVNIATTPYDLRINTAITTRLEGGGIAITSLINVAADFDGDTRNSEMPDIGADEFSGTSIDETAPTVYFTPLSAFQVPAASLNISATIVDRSGVNGSSGTRPRVYYRKRSNTNAFNDNTNSTDGWKYVEASNSSSPFDFAIDYSLLFGGSGVLAGDTIQYFFVAQDLSVTPFIEMQKLNPAVVPLSVDLTSSQFPLSGTVDTYIIFSEISGTVTVGTGGDYTSFTSAGGLFAAINNGVVSSNVSVQVIGDVNEDGTNALNQWKELPQNAGYTVTIQPSDASLKTISGSFGGGLIRLNGADRVTIDGRFEGTGKYLRFTNTNTVTTTAVIQLISTGANTGATNNTIRNCEISSASLSGSAFGIVMGAANTLTSFSGGSDNDNITIMENNFYKIQVAIMSYGLSTGRSKNLQIIGNTIGSENVSEYVTAYGIDVLQADTVTIAENEVFNIISAGSPFGIRVSTGVTNAVISGNKISSIKYTGTFDAGATALHIGTDVSSSNITVANNVIYNIIGRGTNTISTSNTGILVTGSTGGLNFYYNSVNLFGNSDNASKTTQSAAMCFGSAISTGIDMRNNAFSNSIVNNLNSNAKSYAIYSLISGSAFTASDYNNYFASGTQGTLGPGMTTLAQWQSATGKDANSLNVDPLFVSDSNLVPQTGSPLISAGITISGFTTDITGTIRNVSTPAIGAYEDEDPLPVERTSFTAVVVSNKVTLNWKTATEVNNYGFEVERIRSQKSEVRSQNTAEAWSKIGFIEGNGTTNASKEYSYSDKNVNAGNYSYRLKQIDRDGKFSYSQSVEVEIGSAPMRFELAQNYPNPFNPSTVISYQLPVNSHVTLKVYDVIGREVAVLVNEGKEAGRYAVQFDASTLSSGLYFARLASGGKLAVKQMMLLK